MIFSYLLTLFGVCGLAVGTLVVLRAAKGGGLKLGTVQSIRVVGRQAVGAGSTLMLVEIDGDRMLIGVSRSGISVLKTASPASPSEAEGHSRAEPRHPPSTVLDFARTGPSAPLGDASGSFSATLRRTGGGW